ncbi:MAG: FIST C-terminal domain-containing protein [Proteobacteria bacterium]|nr:FIST C-terminal domain-containing protein [Pseudomonadota bacterium]
MEIQTINYNQQKINAWSAPFPSLDSPNTMVLVFAAPKYINDTAPLQALSKNYPNSKIIGCSSAGEITEEHIIDESITVAIIKFSNTTLKVATKEILKSADSEAIGKDLYLALFEKDLRGIFVLSDGLNVNGSELVKGLNKGAKQAQNNVVITGGLAGDGTEFKKTWIISNGEILTKHITAIGFYGDKILIGHASRGGWNVFGPERLITFSKDNILYELDNKPALALYKQYLGKKASDLPATGLLYPLAIRKDEKDNQPLVRTILAVDEKEQSLTFAGDIPQGSLAQFMRSNFDSLITSASEAGTVAFNMISKEVSETTPLLAIAISCVGRRLLLGERTEEETESMLENFPKHTTQIGFYSYGELSPYATGDCRLHNQTMTVTTFYERN